MFLFARVLLLLFPQIFFGSELPLLLSNASACKRPNVTQSEKAYAKLKRLSSAWAISLSALLFRFW